MSQNHQTELGQLREQMKRLVYLFSHDMRNPLVNMKALLSEVHLSLQAVKQGDVHALEHELPDTVQMLDQSVERLSDMIDGANEIYHCMFDPLECETIELKALVERIVNRFADADGVEFNIADMTTLRADPLAVGRIVEELIKNSLQAIGQEGSITMSFDRREGFDVLMVADSGRGISDDALERLFDPFYSGPGHQESASAGMGLTLVKALAEAHGGSVRCESKSSEGATFYVSFPHQAEQAERKV